MFYFSCESQFREQTGITQVPRNAIMLQHLIQFCSIICRSGRLRVSKNKRQFIFQTFSSKIVVAPKIVNWLRNFWYFGNLVATRGSIVL